MNEPRTAGACPECLQYRHLSYPPEESTRWEGTVHCDHCDVTLDEDQLVRVEVFEHRGRAREVCGGHRNLKRWGAAADHAANGWGGRPLEKVRLTATVAVIK